ncbi:hypothetical protein KC19_5G201200 [Ceratodon purpureus]|uniref:Secreted protein n=1 Tax=Ceratodon purpureus TaxID=3225 RepID=A0A8T0I535_CERPU|nr:hypothetical protein KC19_5G201200 [Ceratodon purpureus]
MILCFFSMWWCLRRGWTYQNNNRGLRLGSVFFKSAATLSPGTESMWTSRFHYYSIFFLSPSTGPGHKAHLGQESIA